MGNIGISGEFRCVVSDSKGDIKSDTGYQKNLILNQGLDFFGGGKGSYINNSCVIGGGNSVPEASQIKLDSALFIVTGTPVKTDYSYEDKGDNLYRLSEEKRFRYEGLKNVNISEVGLASSGSTTSNYYLTTRALIKDTLGNPTSVTILEGETFDIFYKIHKFVDTRDKVSVVNMSDGRGGFTPYNVTVRPALVGNSENTVSQALSFKIRDDVSISLSDGELAEITSKPSIKDSYHTNKVVSLASYETGSYKRVVNIRFGLDDANKFSIRSMSSGTGFAGSIPTGFFPFQIRFGSVDGDLGIVKTSSETLVIPLEFSWARYEEAT